MSLSSTLWRDDHGDIVFVVVVVLNAVFFGERTSRPQGMGRKGGNVHVFVFVSVSVFVSVLILALILVFMPGAQTRAPLRVAIPLCLLVHLRNENGGVSRALNVSAATRVRGGPRDKGHGRHNVVLV